MTNIQTLPVITASSQTSIDSFNEIIGLYLASKSTVMPALDKLLASDPQVPMAHLFRTYLLKLASDPRFIQPARASLKAAQAYPLNALEKLHVSVLKTWLSGNSVKATEILEEILSQYPGDILALKIAHHMHFYSGDAGKMRDSIQRVAEFYGPGHPFHGYVLGMQSFGLEESGNYRAAEELGRKAVDENPDDQWAAHAVAHVMQMESRFDEGVAWTASLLPTWHDSNNFVFHVHWHQALFHLGLGDLDAALKIYDEQLTEPLKDDFYLDVCNAASLLWRIEMLGGDVGDRWRNLTQYSTRTADDELFFCTLHYLMAPARLGDVKATTAALAQLEKWQTQSTTQAQIVSEVGAPLAKAICDLGAGRYEAAAAEIARVQPDLYRIGGSHAQRHLFDDMQRWATAHAQ